PGGAPLPVPRRGTAGTAQAGFGAAVPPPPAEPVGAALPVAAGVGAPLAAASVRVACVLAISSTSPSPAPVSSVMYGVGVFIGRLPEVSGASSPGQIIPHLASLVWFSRRRSQAG